jgi:hypothetical protein
MSIERLLQKAIESKGVTDQNNYEVSSEFLRPLKQFLQCSPAVGANAAVILISRLCKCKSTARRARILFLVDYLFCRCQTFREKFCDNLAFVQDFLALKNLSPVDTSLKDELVRLIQLWDLKFGKHFPGLRCLSRYFRESIGLTNTDLIVRYILRILYDGIIFTIRHVSLTLHSL